jgi:uncharacterized protein YhaN
MGKTQTIPEWNTYIDKIWAMFDKIAQRQAETDRVARERQAEIDRIIKETALQQAETDRIVKDTAKQMKETDKRIGELGNRFGEMVESMVLPNLIAKFNELGLPFTKVYPNAKIADKENNIFTEVDAFLENGDKVMIVETKTKPSIDI